MNHGDHVRLLRDGVPGSGGMWADMGSGGGAFTLALAELLGPEGVIYSVDRDRRALREQRAAMEVMFPQATVHCIEGDFTRPLELPWLDGVVMPNSLHFLRQKEPTLALIRGYLKPEGRLVVVEYDTDRGNTWVPYPMSYDTWRDVASRNGFMGTRRLVVAPSRFLGGMYSAVSEVAPAGETP